MTSWLFKLNFCKLPRRTIVGTIAFFLTCSALANPVVDNVAAGQVTIQQTQSTTTINQSSQKAIINWQSFNIGQQEATHFNQPTGGIALNRISPTQGASQIYGSLTATGQIILINPAGIYFGPSSFVNVGGLIATTANLTDANFLSGNFQFNKVDPYSGAVINEGMIIAAQNGLIALVAPSVVNNGMIQADMGKVVLASGNAFTMSFDGNGLVNFAIDEATTSAGTDQNGVTLTDGVKNTGSLIADGGTVIVSAKTASGILDNAINMEGVVQAHSVLEQNGEIILSADTDAANDNVIRLAGVLDASGKTAGLLGGNVTVTSKYILLDDGASIDVSGDAGGGNAWIGGNYQGLGPLPNATAVLVHPNAIVNADAITNGNGGQIILWSNNFLDIPGGQFYARGGAQSGNGGFIETSSKNILNVGDTKVDASSQHGSSGTWLLDPSDIIISGSASANGSFVSNVWTPSAASSTLLGSALVSNLDTGVSGTNTTVSTASGFTANGDITVNTPITWTKGSTLTLTADRNITLNSPISNTTTAGSGLVLTVGVSSNGAMTQATAGKIGGLLNLTLNADSLSDTFALNQLNTYTGTTTINNGAVTLDTPTTANTIANSSSVSIANSATVSITLGGNETINNLSGGGASGGNIALGGNTLTVTLNGQNPTYSGVISGAGNFAVQSTASQGNYLYLNNTNTYTGTTTIGGGVLSNKSSLVLQTPTALNGTSGVIVNSNSSLTFYFSGTNPISIGNSSIVPLTFGASSGLVYNTNGATGSLTLNNPITLTGNLTVGTNTWFGNSQDTQFTLGGTINLNANTMSFNNLYSNHFILSSGVISGTGSLSISNGTLELQGANTFQGGTIIGSGAILQILQLTEGSTTIGTGGISGAGTLYLSSGDLILDDNNSSFTGATLIGNGSTISTLRIAHQNALGSANTSGITVSNSSNLIFTVPGSTTFGNTGVITLNGYTWTSYVPSANNSTLTLNNNITLATSNLNAIFTNWYPEATNGNTATLNLNGNINANGFALQLATKNALDTINVGAGASNGVISGASPIYIGCAAGLGCDLAGTGSVPYLNNGTVIFSKANTYTGATTVNTGTLQLSGSGTAGTTAGSITVVSGATLALAGATIGAEALNLSGTGVSGVGALYGFSGSSSYGGAITLGAAATIGANTSSTLTLSGASITNGANLLTFAGAGNTSVSDIIGSGSGGITKNGAGTVTLTGANSYTGTVTVNTGTLAFNSIGISGVNTALGNSSSALQLGGSGTLQYIGSGHSSSRVINLTGSGGSLDASGSGALTLSGGITGANGYNLILTGISIGSGSGILSGGILTATPTGSTVTKNGAGTWILSNANVYTGGTTINNGLISIGISSAGTPPTITSGPVGTGAVTLNNGTSGISANVAGLTLGNALTVNYGGINGSNSFTLSGIISLATTQLNIFNTATTTISGQMTGVGSLNVATGNGGIVNLNNNSNNFSGGITVGSFSRLVANANNALGTGAILVGSSGTGFLVVPAGVTVSTGSSLSINGFGDGNPTTSGAIITSGSGSSGISIPITVANSAGVNVGSGATLTLSGLISGSADLDKYGAGTLVLTNNLNSYGIPADIGTYVGAGTLSVGANGALGTRTLQLDAGTTLTANSSGLNIANAYQILTSAAVSIGGANNFILSGTGTLNTGSTLTSTNTATTTLSGVIGGAGALAVSGSGTLTLSNNNTYTGGTSIGSGATLLLNNSTTTALGAPSGSTMLSISLGGVLDVNLSTVTIADGKSITVIGSGISSNGAIISSGTGTITRVTSGIIAMGASTTFGGSGSLTLNAPISGTGSITKTGAGTVTLGGTNAFTGNVTINNGTLAITAAGGLANPASGNAINISPNSSNGATLDLSAISSLTSLRPFVFDSSLGSAQLITSAGISFTNSVTLAGSANTFNVLANTTTFNDTGAFSGSGTLIKTGPGTLNMNQNANSYSGGTTINNGTITASVSQALSTAGAINITPLSGNTASLDLTALSSLSNTSGINFNSSAGTAQLLSSTGINLGNLISLTGTSNTFSVAANTTILSNTISGTGVLAKSGAGTLTLSVNNAYSGGTTVNVGTLRVNSAGALSTVGNMSVTSGATLSLNVAGTLTASTGTLTLAGTGVGGIGALYDALSSGTTTVPYSILLGTTPTIAANSGSTLVLNGTINNGQALTLAGPGSITLNGVIGGTTRLTSITSNSNIATLILGGGTINTSSTQTYSGPVTLVAGLAINSTTSNGAISFGSILNGGQTLSINSGSGTVTFSGLVGNTNALTSLSSTGSGTVAINGGGITTTGAQSYTGAVTLGANTALISTANGALTFSNSVTGASQTLTLHQNSSGATGAVTFNGNVTLAGLTTFGGLANYAVSLLGTTNTITNATSFLNTNGVTLGNGGDVFNFTNGLTSNASTTTLASTINTTASSITLGTTTISGNSSLVSTGGAISLGTTNSNGAGTNSLSLTAGAGAINLNNVIGGSLRLSTFTASNTGVANDITIANNINTANNISFTAGRNISLSSGSLNSTSGNISLTGTAGLVQETGAGILGGALLTISSAGGAALNNTNTMSSFNATNTGSGNISFTNSGTLGIAGISQSVGNLTISNTGAITQSGVMTVSGTSSFTAGANAITLNSSNALTGAVSLSNSGANNVTLTNGSALVLGTVGVGTGALGITFGGSSLTQTGTVTQTAAAGAMTLTATAAASDITLSQANNITGAVTFGGTVGNIRDVNFRNINLSATLPTNLTSLTNLRSLTLTYDAAAIALPALTLASSGNLAITAGGAITQSGVLTVPGTSSFSAGTNAITLNSANVLTGAVSLSNSGANNVSLTRSGGILALGTVSVGTGTLSLTGVGITQSGIITQTAGAGAATFNAGAGVITLTNASNSFTGSVSLNNSGANNVALINNGILSIGTSSVGTGTLSLTSAGAITETGAITQAASAGTVTISSTTVASDITLLQANSLTGAITFGGTPGNIRDVNLRNVSASAGLPTNLVNANLRNLTLAYDNAAIVLPAITLVSSGNLSVTAGGAITQSGVLTIPGTSTFNAGANAITLTQANAFTGAVSLTNSGATNDASITNANALIFGTSNVGRNIIAIITGNLTQSGATTLTATGLSVTASGDVTLANNNSIGTIAASLSGSTKTFSLINNAVATLSVGAVGSVIGIATTNGNISVTNNNGALSTDQAINAGSGNVTLATGNTSNNLTLGANITGTTINLQATGSISQSAGALNATNLTINNTTSSTTLGGNNAIANLSSITATGQTVSLTNTVDLAQVNSTNLLASTLNITSSGAVSLGQGVSQSNNVGTLIATLSGSTKALTFTNAADLILGAISTTNGAVTATSTNNNLTVNGNLSAGTAAVNLTASGTDKLLTINSAKTVTASGGITYTADNMTLTGNTSATAGAVNLRPYTTGGGAAIILGGTVSDSAGILALNNAELGTISTTGLVTIGTSGLNGNLTVSQALDNANRFALITNATLAINAAIGGTSPVNGIAFTGNTSILLGANVTSSGNSIIFNNQTTPSANAVVTNSGDIIFSGAITPNASNLDLTASAGSGNITFGAGVGQNGTIVNNLILNSLGTTTFSGAVSATSVTTDAGGSTVINGGSVFTSSGSQSYGDAITLGATTTLTASGGNVSAASTINGGGFGLTVFNNLSSSTLSGAISNLSSFTKQANGTLSLGGVNTYTGTTIISGGTLKLLAGGSITNSSVSLDNTFSATLDVNGQTKTIAGLTGGAGTSGNEGVVALGTSGSLTVNVSGSQIYDGLITGTNSAFVLGSGTLTLTDSNSNNGSFSINNGATLIASNNNALGTGTATLASGGTLQITNGITLSNALSLSGTIVGSGSGTSTYSGAITLGGNGILNTASAANNLTISGTVNDNSSGAHTLTTTGSGTLTFSNTIGNSTAIKNLITSTSGNTVITSAGSSNSISTIEGQTYRNPITLSKDVTLTASSATLGAIIFNSSATINGAKNLTVNSGAGTTVNAAIGGLTPLTSLHLAGAAIDILSANITTAGNQTYDHAISLGNNILLTANPGSITFNNTIDGAFTLGLSSTLGTTFNAVVGGSTPLAGLTLTADNVNNPTDIINTTAISTAGSQSYGNALSSPITNGTLTLTATGGTSDISFSKSLSWGTTRTLSLISGRNITFSDIDSLNASGNSVVLNAVGTISSVVNVNLANFTLTSGIWSQLGSGAGTLQTFSISNDFSLNIPNAGTLFERYQNGVGSLADPYQIADIYGLQGIGSNTTTMANTRYYFVSSNIDASATANWNSNSGFIPIGNNSTNFNAHVNGNGSVISNLFINRPSTDYVGLFGQIGSTGTVTSIGVTSSGTIAGQSNVGILAGRNDGSIDLSYTTGAVSASLAGVTYLGGLVGYNNGAITNAYSQASVTASNASGTTFGGLLGFNNTGNTVTNTYATGLVSGGSGVSGGLVGNNAGTIVASFWDTDSTNQSAATGSNTGTLTNVTGGCFNGTCTNGGTVNMSQMATYQSAPYNWDFSTPIWRIDENTSYPYLDVFNPATFRIISGTVSVADGTLIRLLANGTDKGTVSVSGDAFSFNIPFGAIADGASLLLFIDGSSTFANTIALAPNSNGNLTGLLLTANSLNVDSSFTSASNSTINAAKNSYVDTDILYTGSSSSLSLGGLTGQSVALTTSSATSYNINGIISTLSGVTSSLAFNGAVAINTSSVTTTGNQTYARAVTIGANTTLNAGSGAINFSTPSSTINGANALTLTAAGAISFNGIVGGNTPLTALTISNGSSGVAFNAASITTSGNQTYNNNVITLGTNALLISSSGDITDAADIHGGNNTLTISNAGSASLLAGALSNLSGFTKSGSGTLQLNGANTYAGDTTFNGGTLILNNNSALGTTGSLIYQSGTLAAGPAGITFSNPIILQSNMTFGGSNDFTVSSGISQSGGTYGITKTGSSVLTLSGTNTFGGSVNLNQGTIKLGSYNAINNSGGDLMMSAGTTLALDRYGAVIGNLSGDGTITMGNANPIYDAYADLTINQHSATTFAGDITGSGDSIFMIGNGVGTAILTVSGNISATVNGTGIGVRNATLRLGNNNVINDSNYFYFDTNGTWDLNNFSDTAQGIYTVDTASILLGNSGGNTLTLDTTQGITQEFLGVISGAGNIVKMGPDTQIFGGNNTYTGTTTVTNGVLWAWLDATSLGQTSAINVSNTGTLQLVLNSLNFGTLGNNALITLNGNGYNPGSGNLGALYINTDVSLNNNIQLAGNTYIRTDNTATLNGIISNATGVTTADLTVGGSGSNTTILTAHNTYVGDTYVRSGTLMLGINDALPTTTNLTVSSVSSGAIFNLNNFSQTIGNLMANPNTATINMGSGTFSIAQNSNQTFSGSINSSGGILNLNAGANIILTLAGSNGLDSVNINTGTLQLSGSGYLGTYTQLNVAAGATFDMNDVSDTIASLAGAGAVTLGSASLTVGVYDDSSLYSGIMSSSTGGSLVKSGTGSFELSGTNTFNGGVTLNDGTLIVSNDSVLGSSAGTFTYIGGTLATGTNNITIANPVDLQANLAINSGFNFALTGNIADTFGSYGLTKDGTNILRLAGNSTFTGGVTINNGILIADNNNALGTGGATVNNGATLQLGNINAVSIANNLILNGTGYTGTAGALQGTGTGTNIVTGGITVNSTTQIAAINNSDVLDLSGIIGGALGNDITYKSANAGSIIIRGTNTYAGGSYMDMANGNLQVANDSAFGSGKLYLISGNVSAISAPVSLSNDFEVTGNAAITGVINLSLAGAGTLDNSTTLSITNTALTTLSGNIDGAGSLTENAGSGTLLISGTNNSSYTGTTTLTSGTLRIGVATNALGSGNVALNGGNLQSSVATATLANSFAVGGSTTINGSNNLILGDYSNSHDIALNSGSLSITNTATTTLVGSLSGSAALNENSVGGTLNVTNGANGAYTGMLTLTSGILQIANTTNGLGTGALALNGGTLRSTGSATLGNAFTVGGATGSTLGGSNNIIFSSTGVLNNTLNISNSANTNFNDIVSGASGITLSGNVTFAANNNYSGTTTINGGTLTLDNVTLSNSPISMNNGSVIGSGTASLSGVVTLVSSSNNIIQASGGSSLTLGGDINGAGNLTLQGGGIITVKNIGNSTALSSLASATPTLLGSANTIIRANTINFSTTLNGASDLTLTSSGTTTLGGIVGGSTALNSLAINASAININGGAITTTFDQTYNANVALGADTILTSTGTGTINMTLNSGISGNKNITLIGGNTANTNFIIAGTLATSSITIHGGAGGGINSFTVNSTSNQNWNLDGISGNTLSGISGVSGTFSFSNIRNLIGGDYNDNFTLSNGGALLGSINGGAGNNTFTADNVSNTWNLSGTNAATSVTGVGGGFSYIQNLIGGNGNDNFIFADNANITGTISGGVSLTNTGNNILSFSAYSTLVNGFMTSGSNTFIGYIKNSSNSIIANYNNIDRLIGNSLNDNVLTLPNGKGISVVTYNFGTTRQGYIDDPLYFDYFRIIELAPPAPTPTPTTTAMDVAQIVQQPSTTASTNANSATSLTSTWILTTSTLGQNISDLTNQVTQAYDSDLDKIKINPYCMSTNN